MYFFKAKLSSGKKIDPSWVSLFFNDPGVEDSGWGFFGDPPPPSLLSHLGRGELFASVGGRVSCTVSELLLGAKSRLHYIMALFHLSLTSGKGKISYWLAARRGRSPASCALKHCFQVTFNYCFLSFLLTCPFRWNSCCISISRHMEPITLPQNDLIVQAFSQIEPVVNLSPPPPQNRL